MSLQTKYEVDGFHDQVFHHVSTQASKIQNELGFKPSITFEEGLRQTAEWYLNNAEWVENIISGDYAKYYEEMYGDK